MRKRLLLTILALSACGPAGDAREETAPITVEAVAGVPLADVLTRMDGELARALEGRLEGASLENFLRAEAISDRLLETQFPFAWLRGENYSVEARLRQIQALSDRIMAQIESGSSRDSTFTDLQALRSTVVGLRRALAQGGGAAPPSLERLLAGRDTLNLDVPEGPGGE